MYEKIVGGELELNLNLLKKQIFNKIRDFGIFSSSGRSALYLILQYLKSYRINKILLPEYLCSSIVSTVSAAGFEYDFYQLNDHLLPVINDIEIKCKNATVLVINYFGLQDLKQVIRSIKGLQNSPIVIEDDVQAFYNYIESRFGSSDYAFTSLRKWFPVPDGGFSYSSYEDLYIPKEYNSFWDIKLSGLVLKGLREELGNIDNIYLKLLAEGEKLIDKDLFAKGCDITKNIFERIDLNRIALVRQRNANIILSGLKDIGIQPLIVPCSGSVPFFIPICLENRDSVRKKLFSKNIFFPVHWPLDGLLLKRGAYLADHELSIVIDQRYGTSDMERIIDVLSDSISQQ